MLVGRAAQTLLDGIMPMICGHVQCRLAVEWRHMESEIAVFVGFACFADDVIALDEFSLDKYFL